MTLSVDRGTFLVLLYDHQGRLLKTLPDIAGLNADDAVDRAIRNHLEKEKRLEVRAAAVFRQWEAQRRVVNVDADYRISPFEEAVS
jgi:hypothetical protein